MTQSFKAKAWVDHKTHCFKVRHSTGNRVYFGYGYDVATQQTEKDNLVIKGEMNFIILEEILGSYHHLLSNEGAKPSALTSCFIQEALNELKNLQRGKQ